MAQTGEGHEAHGASPQVLAFGLPAIGEILADRYQVEEHVGDDTRGRQLYRGMDVVLRRPVTIVLRQPGGEAASEMLAAAVAASRVVHPHLVGVYDAIDEGERAYVVREWIDGISLRDAVAEGPLDAARAVAITRAISEAVSALHETGVVHGNVHPGTVMIAQDGRVMLADARADDAASEATDARALGGVLYAALTGFWPYAEAGPAPLPDGVHEGGRLVPPGQVRPGIPPHVDELAVSLLDPEVQPATAMTITAELAAMVEPIDEDDEYDNSFNIASFDGSTPQGVVAGATRRKLMIALGALVAIALVGALAAMQFGGPSTTNDPGNKPGAKSSTASHQPATQQHVLQLTADKVRICLAPGSAGSNRDATQNAALTVDGDLKTGWKTQHYATATFGNLRSGMGVWIDLTTAQRVVNVQVNVSRAGATMELRGGNADPGNGQSTADGDAQIVSTYQPIAPSTTAGTNVVLNGNDTPVRYLLVWITQLPYDPTAQSAYKYGFDVDEIAVTVQ